MQKSLLRHLGLLAALVLVFTITMVHPATASHSYILKVIEPHAHYLQVEIHVKGASKTHTDFSMPVWTPGSYLVREYAKNVEGFKVEDDKGIDIAFEKTNRNTWQVANGKVKNFTVSYRVYAFELSVRNAYVDAEHAYLNPAAVFMVPVGAEKEKSTLTIVPLGGWKKVATALPKVDGNVFVRAIPDWDTFIDSPIEIGNHQEFGFTAAGVKHTVAWHGPLKVDTARLRKDMVKIVETATAIFQHHPCTEYTFIVHAIPNGSGGLEHSYSTTLQVNPNSLTSEQGYLGFMGLVSHEYFHLWNVKRLRPVVLGPFNYNEENYTRMLWVSEGFTAYYDDYILLRAGIMKADRFLETTAGNMNATDATPGDRIQTLTESSFDAWIKYYRRTENSGNSEVNYYTKGAVVALHLDLMIRQASGNKACLDDAMRYAYETYYLKQNRGFTDMEFKQVLEKFYGKSLDAFYAKFINGTEPMPHTEVLDLAGLTIQDRNANTNVASFGCAATMTGGRTVVTNVARNGACWTHGIYVNDEVIAINNERVNQDINIMVSDRVPGDVVDVLISRNGKLQTVRVTLGRNPARSYRVDKVKQVSEAQKALLESWLALTKK